jgi:glycine cleavage system H protein
MVPQPTKLQYATTLDNTSADSLLAGVDKLYSSIISFVAGKRARCTTNLLCNNELAARAGRESARGTSLVLVEAWVRQHRRLAMTVILFLLMLTIFLAIDFVVSRRHAPEHVAQTATESLPAAAPVEPVWVGGYQLPEDRRYHLGHTWVRPLSPTTAAVGIDDFARHLIGPAKSVTLPEIGARLTAGRPSFIVESEAGGANLVAPLTGEVIDVNTQLETHPGLATDEPYGRGWLFNVKTHDLAAGLRNLLGGSMARRWTEDSRDRLNMQLVALSGSVLQDGGEPVADFARHLPGDDWQRLTRDFFVN